MHRLYYLDVTPALNDAVFAASLSRVSAERQKKCLSYRFPRDRALSLGASLLLSAALAEEGLREAELTYAVTEHGKPRFPEAPTFHFNLSHAGVYALLAVSGEEVGCDIEQIAPFDPRLPARFFAPAEQAAIAEAAEKELLFTRIWTKKESYTKATGTGLTVPLSSFTVPISPANGYDGGKMGAYSFYEYSDIPGYCVTLCTTAVSPPPLCDRSDLWH